MLIDVEGKGELDIESFIKGCMRLSGQAQSKDILEVLINVGTLGKHLTQLEEKVGHTSGTGGEGRANMISHSWRRR